LGIGLYEGILNFLLLIGYNDMGYELTKPFFRAKMESGILKIIIF
jgi:hypothetical protein